MVSAAHGVQKFDEMDEEDTVNKLHIVDEDASASAEVFSPATSIDGESTQLPETIKQTDDDGADTKAKSLLDSDGDGDGDDFTQGDSAQSITSGTVSASANRAEKRRRVIERKIRNSRGKNRITPVVDQNGTKFICPLCNEPQASQSDLTVHIRSHNQANPSMNICTLCGKALSSQSSLDRHMLVHSGERPFCCKICGMSFTTNGNMHRHMKVHEHDVDCDINELINLEKKRRRKPKVDGSSKPSDAKVAKLDNALALPTTVGLPALNMSADSGSDCAASTSASALPNLVTPNMSYSDILKMLPIKSALPQDQDDDESDNDEAQEGSEANGSIAENSGAQQGDDGEVAAESDAGELDERNEDEADEVEMGSENDDDADVDDSSQKLDSSAHVGELENGANASANLPPIPTMIQIPRPGRPGRRGKLGAPLRKCKHCSEAFTTVNALRVHIRTHMGLSPYRCSVCAYTSVDKSTLVRHLRTHNGQRPFMCRECGFAFTTKANCERHIRTRHHKTNKDEIRALLCFSSVHGEGVDTAISAVDSVNGQTFTSPDTVCRYCGKDLHFFRALKKHLRVHMPPRKTGSGDPKLPICADANTDVVNASELKVDVPVSQAPSEKASTSMPHFSSPLELSQNPSLFDQYKNAITTLAATWQKLLSNTQLNESAGAQQLDTNESVDPDAPLDLSIKAKREHTSAEAPLDLSRSDQKSVDFSAVRAKSGSESLSPSKSPIGLKADSGFASTTMSPENVKLWPGAGSSLSLEAILQTFAPKQLQRSAIDSITLADLRNSKGEVQTTEANALVGGTKGLQTPRDALRLRLQNRHWASKWAAAIGNNGDTSKSTILKGASNSATSNASAFSNDHLQAQEEEDGENCENGGIRIRNGDGTNLVEENSQRLADEDEGGEEEEENSEEDPNSSGDEDGSNPDGATGESSKRKRNSYSDSPKRIQCPYCTRSFPWISSLKRHLITHTGQKPFRCPRCSLNFSTKSNRERHLLRKHGVYVRRGVSRLKDKALLSKVDQDSLKQQPVTENNSDSESVTYEDADTKSITPQSSNAGKAKTLEATELSSMSISDAVADSLGEKLLESATLIMQPNSKRQEKRRSSQDLLSKTSVLELQKVRRRQSKVQSHGATDSSSAMNISADTLPSMATSMKHSSGDERSMSDELESVGSEYSYV